MRNERTIYEITLIRKIIPQILQTNRRKVHAPLTNKLLDISQIARIAAIIDLQQLFSIRLSPVPWIFSRIKEKRISPIRIDKDLIHPTLLANILCNSLNIKTRDNDLCFGMLCKKRRSIYLLIYIPFFRIAINAANIPPPVLAIKSLTCRFFSRTSAYRIYSSIPFTSKHQMIHRSNAPASKREIFPASYADKRKRIFITRFHRHIYPEVPDASRHAGRRNSSPASSRPSLQKETASLLLTYSTHSPSP